MGSAANSILLVEELLGVEKPHTGVARVINMVALLG